MARILIVDDSPTQAQSLAMVLDGHEVGTASGGQEARARLAEGGWDLVVSDVVMPGESGYDLCRAIKRQWRVPVLLLTSLSRPSEILRALEAGADSFATKNADPGVLLLRVETLLAGRPSAAERPGAPGPLPEGDPVSFMGQTYHIGADRAQILSLLLTTFEDLVRKNELLVESERLLEDRIQRGHAMEEELRRKNVELLDQNQKVQDATRLKSDFLASMSHELRTPLNGIIGFIEVMLDGVVGEPAPAHREYLEDVLTSARHLLRLINDVLDLAKVESGKMDLFVETVELEPLLEDTVDIVRTQVGRRKIKLAVEGHPDVRQVVVDPARFKQIIYNYLSNAVKFTPEGGKITVRVRPDGTECYRVEVEDTGRGIRPDDLKRLFVAFQQLEPDRRQGTGLGLALTRQLVELQHGHVDVTSEVGKGSTFSVVLPRVVRSGDLPALVPPVPLPVRPAGHIPRGLLEGVPVLIIDGHAVSLKLMEILLKAQGCVVYTATSGASALAAWNQLQPQVVLMEVRLPDISGYELLRVLRQADPPPRTILAVTAAVMKEELQAAKAAGFDGLLAKPIEPRLFPSQLKAMLQGDGGAG